MGKYPNLLLIGIIEGKRIRKQNHYLNYYPRYFTTNSKEIFLIR